VKQVIGAMLLVAVLLPAAFAEGADIQARSLLGDRLYPPDLPADVREDREQKLAEAVERYKADTDDPDNLIWYGRRLAYLGLYQEAIVAFSEGIRKYPQDARFYRHRGHRFITTRQFDTAIGDLTRAADLIAGTPDEIEPDGLPNAQNIPTSTLQSNIWYHLGLAFYLEGRFEEALAAYVECTKVSKNADMWSATTHWQYMTLRRLDRDEDAAKLIAEIPPAEDIIENHTYHRLLQMYRGEADEAYESDADLDNATYLYGLGNWKLYRGRDDEAMLIFATILDNPQWAAFGYIAAEAELARDRFR
jgi:tetratricopeptide (TPR) repeat protein